MPEELGRDGSVAEIETERLVDVFGGDREGAERAAEAEVLGREPKGRGPTAVAETLAP